jgi:SAM-dependent methyltransferase
MNPVTLVIIATVIQALALIAGVLLLLWLVFLAVPGLLGGPPFLGSRPEYAAAAFALAELKPGERVLDLGSGDGRLLLAAAAQGAQATGYEINLLLVWWSRFKALVAGQRARVRVHWQDFAKADLAAADLVVLYCTDAAMTRLAERFRQELPAGARVITLRYPIPDWEPVAQNGPAHLYRL